MAGGGGILSLSVHTELQGILMLANQIGFHRTNDPHKMFTSLHDFPLVASPLIFSPAPHVATRPELAMVYAITSRSRHYLHALLHAGIAPSFVLLLGEKDDSEPLLAEMQQYGIRARNIASKDINAKDVWSAIMNLPQKFIIYSGYGGGILQKEYFTRDKKFIHVHAGRLPQYKGSTSCYYSLLNDNEICATAIFLDPSLDGGDILSHYCMQAEQICALQNTDIDMAVEPYIRAKALIETIKMYLQNGNFAPIAQKTFKSTPSETYYKIHPVLKHLAFFKVFGQHVDVAKQKES